MLLSLIISCSTVCDIDVVITGVSGHRFLGIVCLLERLFRIFTRFFLNGLNVRLNYLCILIAGR